MKPSHTTRLVAAVIAVISLLFTQLALASYVCPGMTMPDRMEMAMADNSAHDMAGCTGMDIQQPGLCHAHDHTGQQSLDKPDVPQVPPFAAMGLVLIVQTIDLSVPPATAGSETISLAHATAPPLAIRHCCFRI